MKIAVLIKLLLGMLNLPLSFIMKEKNYKNQQAELSVQTGHTSPVVKLQFNPDQSVLVSADRENNLVIWDVALGKQYNVILHPDKVIHDFVFVNDSMLAVSFDQPVIRLYNIKTCKAVKDYAMPDMVGGLSYVEGTNELFCGANVLQKLNLNDGSVKSYQLKSHNYFSVLKVSQRGKWLIAGGKYDRFFSIVRIRKMEGSEMQLLNKGSGFLTDAEINESDSTFLVATADGKIKKYISSIGAVDGATSDFPANAFTGVARTKDYIIGTTEKSGVMVYSVKDWSCVNKLENRQGSFFALACSKDSSLIAAGNADGGISLFDTRSLLLLKKIKGNVKRINSISFTPDGNNLCIGYDDGSIRISNLIDHHAHAARMQSSRVGQALGWKYAVASVKAVNEDSVTVGLYYLHRTTNYYTDLIEEVKNYSGSWTIKDGNNLHLTLNKKEDTVITDYLRRVKKMESVGVSEIYPASNLSATAANGNVFYTDGKFILLKTPSGKVLYKVDAGHSDRVSGVTLNENCDLVATAGWDGLVRFFRLSDGKFICTYGAFGAKDFIYLDEENNYFASKGALNYIAFRYGGKVYPFDQFDLRFNRPDLVLNQLPYIDKETVGNFSKAFKKRLKKLNKTEKDLVITTAIPKIKLKLPDQLISSDGNIKFNYSAEAKRADLNALYVVVNGVTEGSRDGKSISGRKAEGEVNVALNYGNNIIQVFVSDETGNTSLKETFNVYNNAEPVKPDLYLVVMGASEYKQNNFNLKYAAKDADDFNFYMKKNKYFNLVQVKSFLNSSVNSNAEQEIANFISGAKVNDVVMILYAGHGVLNNDLDYFLASYDMDFSKPEDKGISYEKISQVLEKTASRSRVLFLDACHSGELDKEEVTKTQNKVSEGDLVFRAGGNSVANMNKINSLELAKSVFADFRANNGAWVISSAGATEYAIEGGQWNNGVFTYALLQGLQGNADLNKDGKLMISELQYFLSEEVNKATSGKQKPNLRNENLFNDIRIK